jgi:hypothetical protein
MCLAGDRQSWLLGNHLERLMMRRARFSWALLLLAVASSRVVGQQPQSPVALYNVGARYAAAGKADSALFWLDSASKAGFNALPQYQTDSDLTSLHANPKFAELLTRVDRKFQPCKYDANARKFDFWVGDWDVRPNVANGPIVGSSSVQVVSGSCALLENWTSARGQVGKSLNAYNAATGGWQQFWIGQLGGTTEYRESSWDGPTLVFVARPNASGPSTAPVVRLSFTPVSADQVRQHGEISNDGGKTWSTTYDFMYFRRK